jgi:hypothetical protein
MKIGCWIIFHFLLGVAIMFWTDRNMDWLFSQIKGETVDVPFWISAITSILLSELILILNIVLELVRLIY